MSHELTAISTNEEPDIGLYKSLNTIGQGSFAKVRLARHILTGSEVAVKVIQQQGYFKYPEFHCLRVLNHPNIVKLSEVIETQTTMYLVMERVPGLDVHAYLTILGCLNENEAQGIFRQLVSAVKPCHQRGIVHRDLKPENVLLDAGRNPKLIDFGLSAEFIGYQLSSVCSTVAYVAPELFLGQGSDGPKLDVWSLGVLLYQMVTGTLPFLRTSFYQLWELMLTGHFPSYLSLDCIRMLKKLMAVNHSDRGMLENVMKERWINLGQKDELRPSTEPPWDNKDPWVTQRMMQMGFEWEQIEQSVTRTSYDPRRPCI